MVRRIHDELDAVVGSSEARLHRDDVERLVVQYAARDLMNQKLIDLQRAEIVVAELGSLEGIRVPVELEPLHASGLGQIGEAFVLRLAGLDTEQGES